MKNRHDSQAFSAIALFALVFASVAFAFGGSPPSSGGPFAITSKRVEIRANQSCVIGNSVTNRTITWEAQTRTNRNGDFLDVSSENYISAVRVADIYVSKNNSDFVTGDVSQTRTCTSSFGLTGTMQSLHRARALPGDTVSPNAYVQDSNSASASGL